MPATATPASQSPSILRIASQSGLIGSPWRRRTLHLRFNDLSDPQPIPRDTDYASVFESDTPVIVQHTRLDSRRAVLALLSTVAYAES